MGKIKDLSGEKFGKLTCIDYFKDQRPNGSARIIWNCICDCGNEVSVRADSLKSNETKSCGCLSKELSRDRLITHGLTNSSEYRAWVNCRERCEKNNHPSYHNYGGRGIKISEQWKNSFEVFFHDMGPKPHKDLTLERLDVNGDYCKENCVWATWKEQSLNKRVSSKNISGKTGVIFNTKNQKWDVSITVSAKKKRLIRTGCLELAIFCRQEAELHYYGQIFGQ